MTTATEPLAGAVHLRHGASEATIAPVGASVHAFRHGGRDVFMPFDPETTVHRYHGALLAPWPNRVMDGRYVLDGVEHRLPLSEPERGHALHGLVTDAEFAVVERRADAATLATSIAPQPGYPFAVDVEVRYRLDDDGLRTKVAATNRSQAPAPFGTGAHPWIAVATGLEDAVLQTPATALHEVHGERMRSGSVVDVPAWADFREPRRLGDARIDHAFTGLHVGDGAEATIRIVGRDGRGAALRLGSDVRWLQLCTWDWADAHERTAIAVEPMTCGPDAFNTGADVALLEPGEPREWSWTYTPIEGAP